MIEELDQFEAVTETGETIVIRRLQNIVRHPAMSGTHPLGEPFYITTTDQPVKEIDSQTFEILETKEIVRKI